MQFCRVTIMQKNKKTIKNTGDLPKYLIRNHHIAIIDREVFDAVQIELSRRNCIKRNENKYMIELIEKAKKVYFPEYYDKEVEDVNE